MVALEQAVAAPFCTSRLADAGARVIKIEREGGDFARSYDSVANGESAYFVWLNRGKESVCLDIKADKDKSLLMKMLASADVFVQNLSPGAASRAGFDSDLLRAEYPQLITCDISGYGELGSYREMKAYDLLVQCESGLASITGTEEKPGRVGVSICDIACGLYAYTAILEALMERTRSITGAGIKVSLFDAVADWMTVPLLHFDYGGSAPPRVGINHPSIAPYGVYMAADGKPLVIAIQNEREWRRFCELVIDKPDLIDDIRFRDNESRCANRPAMDEEINEIFSRITHENIVLLLQRAGIAFSSVNEIEDLSRHPQLRRATIKTPSGPVSIPAPPALFSGKRGELAAVPALGEHSSRIRKEFEDISI